MIDQSAMVAPLPMLESPQEHPLRSSISMNSKSEHIVWLQQANTLNYSTVSQLFLFFLTLLRSICSQQWFYTPVHVIGSFDLDISASVIWCFCRLMLPLFVIT